MKKGFFKEITMRIETRISKDGSKETVETYTHHLITHMGKNLVFRLIE